MNKLVRLKNNQGWKCNFDKKPALLLAPQGLFHNIGGGRHISGKQGKHSVEFTAFLAGGMGEVVAGPESVVITDKAFRSQGIPFLIRDD